MPKARQMLTFTRWTFLVLLPAAAAALTAAATASTGQARTNYILGAIGCALSLAALQVYGEYHKWRSDRTAVAAKAALAGSIHRSGRPLVTLLGRVAEARHEEDRRAHLSTLVSKCVQVAQSQCGWSAGIRCETRCVFYEFTSDDKLVRRYYEGRQHRVPRLDFTASRNANDQGVISTANGEDAVLVVDVDNGPPGNFADYVGRDYKSFLVVPVRTETKSYGLLSVDSDQPGSLVDADVGYVVLIAGLLAAAHAFNENCTTCVRVNGASVPRQVGVPQTEGKG